MMPEHQSALKTMSADDSVPRPCLFCGYCSKKNRRHYIDRHPLNHHRDNLSWVDPLCEAWQNMDSLTSEQGFIAYLPEIKPEDVNHLQRTAFFALQSPDEVDREAGKAVMNWLSAHKKESEEIWGTSDPNVFAQALRQASEEEREELQNRWQHLALILPPKAFLGRKFFEHQGIESDSAHWSRIYQEFLTRDLL